MGHSRPTSARFAWASSKSWSMASPAGYAQGPPRPGLAGRMRTPFDQSARVTWNESLGPGSSAGFLGPVEPQGFDAGEQASPAWAVVMVDRDGGEMRRRLALRLDAES